MQKINVPLAEMSLEQKLELMEVLWADLSKNEETLPSPEWHKSVLEDRAKAYAEGRITASDWEEAKERIMKRCHDRHNP